MTQDLARRIAALSPAQRRALESQTRKPVTPERLSIAAGRAPSPAPASSNQEYLWMLDQRSSGNPGWNVFTGAEFVGPLDAVALHCGLLEIARRHEAVRTTLRRIDGTLMQVIRPELEFSLPILDLSELPPHERGARSRAAMARLYGERFDLSEGPLIRPALLRLAGDDHQLLVIMHHTITDWVSFAILNREMAELYHRYTGGDASPLPPPALQYRDYAFWEKEWEETSEEGQAQSAYWKRKLADAPECTPLPFDRARPPVQTSVGARSPIALSPEVSAALIAESRAAGHTPFMTVLAVLGVLLRAIAGSDDVVIGSPVIGRLIAGTENALGLFLNHIALRLDVSGNPAFRALMAQVKAVVIEAYANQQVPFGKIVRELRPNPNPAFTPLFQVMFFYLAVPPIEPFPGLEWRNLEAYGDTSRYDLLFSLWERPEGVTGFVEYNTDLFEAETAARIAVSLETMVIAAVSDLDLPVSKLAEIGAREFDAAKKAARS